MTARTGPLCVLCTLHSQVLKRENPDSNPDLPPHTDPSTAPLATACAGTCTWYSRTRHRGFAAAQAPLPDMWKWAWWALALLVLLAPASDARLPRDARREVRMAAVGGSENAENYTPRALQKALKGAKEYRARYYDQDGFVNDPLKEMSSQEYEASLPQRRRKYDTLAAAAKLYWRASRV